MVLLSLSYKPVLAQVYIDIINTGFSQNSAVEYKDSNNKYEQQNSWLHLNIPIVYNSRSDFLMPRLEYNYGQLQHDFFIENPLRFHNINLGISWLKNWKNSQWAHFLGFGAGISSDLKYVKGDHYNYDARLLFFYGKKKKLIWNFGVTYIGCSFGNYIVPMLGVDWRIDEKLNLSFQTFSHLQLDYQLNSKIYVGISAQPSPFAFNISDYNGVKDSYIHTYSNEFPYTPQSISIYQDSYIKNELVLFAKAGYEFAKALHQVDMNGMTQMGSPYRGEVAPGYSFEIGIAFRRRTARKFKYQ